MRHFIRGLLALALVVGATRTGSGTAVPQQSGNTDRLPSDSYPQWFSVLPGGPINTNLGLGSVVSGFEEQGFIDASGTIYTAVAVTAGGKWGAALVNDNFHSRTAYGLSMPNLVTVQFDSPAACAVGSNKVVHAVWIERETIIDEYGLSNAGDKLIYRSLTDGVWSGANTIIPPVLRRFVSNPLFLISPGGAAHIYATMIEADHKPPPNVNYSGSYLGYASAGGYKKIDHTMDLPFPWSHPWTGGGGGTSRAILKMLGESTAVVIWVGGFDAESGGTSGAHYNVGGPGADANANQMYIADPTAGGAPLGGSRAWFIDGSGNDHVFYFYGTSTEIKHAVNNALVETIPLPPNVSFGDMINIDSRGQIHALGYNYWVKTSNGWVAPPPGVGTFGGKMIFDRNDRMVVFGSGVQRTLPVTLGVKDPVSHAAVMPGGSVDLLNGNFHYRLPLFSTRGTGPCQAMTLYLNTLDNRKGFIAPGWRLNYEMHLTGFKLTMPDGRPVTFEATATPDVFIPPYSSGDSGTLVRLPGTNPSEYVLIVKDGTQYYFNASGKLRSIQDASANRTDLIYDAEGYLVQVTDQLGNGGPGRSSFIQYDGPSGGSEARRMSRITDPLGTSYSLTYAGNNLSGVSFSGGSTSPQYSFDWSSRTVQPGLLPFRIEHLERVTTPLGGNYDFEYLPDHRVSKVADPLGKKVEITYDESIPVNQNRKTTVKDRRGYQTEYTLDRKLGLVLQIKDSDVLAGAPNLFPIVRTFGTSGLLWKVTDRWGKETSFGWGGAGANAPGVGDMLATVYRPKANAAGTEMVLWNTFTCAALGAPVTLATSTSYASPTGTSTPVGRVTTCAYADALALDRPTSITYPDVTRYDGVVQTAVKTQPVYGGPRKQATRITNEENHTVDFSDWDPLVGLPRRIEREGGTQDEELQYDVMGNVVRQTRPKGGSGNDGNTQTVYVYDGLQRLIQTIDPAGSVTSFEYDAWSNVVRVIPPAGGATTTTFDVLGRPIAGTTPDGSWSKEYDENGNVVKSTDLRGQTSTFTYDSLGRVIESKVPGGSLAGPGGGGGPDTHTTQYAYELFDATTQEYFSMTTEVGAPANRVSKSYFDNRGRVKRTVAPDNQTKTETIYDEQDQVVATHQLFGSALQTCTVLYRDARQRVDRVRTQDAAYLGTPTNTSNTYTFYNKAGSVMTTVDPLGSPTGGGFAHRTTYLRDARERVTDVIDGKGNIVKHTIYGDDDLPVEVRVPDPATKTTALVAMQSFEYTGRKELKRTLDRNNGQTQYAYNATPGELAQVTDVLNRVKSATYHPIHRRPTQITEAAGTADQTVTNYEWDSGFLTETKVFNPESGAVNASFKNFYDAAGRLERKEYPSVQTGTPMAAEQHLYNDFGETDRIIAGAKQILHAYNQMGRLIGRTWTGPRSGSETRTYNEAGFLSSITNGTQTVDRTYNAWNGTPLDEIFAVSGQTWKMQTKQTDVAGNTTGLIDAQAQTHGWPVDENNRPSEKKLGSQGVTSITYTPGGLIDTETLKNAAGAAIARTIHYYDSLGRQTHSQTVNISTSETLSDYGYKYNAAGEVTEVVVNHLSAVFTITNDALGRMKTHATSGNNGGANAPPFENTLVPLSQGNVSVPSGEAKGSPSLRIAVPSRSASYAYGASGNRQSQTVDGVQTTYQYNALNQLISETSPGKTVTHVYDDLGNETRRETTVSGQSTVTETYEYNHQNLMSVYANNGTGAAWQYDYWPGGERYGKTDLGTFTSELYIPRDGDVVTDYEKIAGGTPTLKNTYVQGLGIDSKVMRLPATSGRRFYLGDKVGTVGATMDDTATLIETSVKDGWGQTISGTTTERYGFAQRELDTESGLVYMRHRMYDPRTGRFTQTDPILGNRPGKHYTYASNNPVSRIDPRGLQDDPTGHHVIPEELWDDILPKNSPLRAILDNERIPTLGHNRAGHAAYTEEVRKILDGVKGNRHLSQLSPQEIDTVITRVYESPKTKDFLLKVHRASDAARAAENALTPAQKAAITKKWGKFGMRTFRQTIYTWAFKRMLPVALFVGAGANILNASEEGGVVKARQAAIDELKGALGVDIAEGVVMASGEWIDKNIMEPADRARKAHWENPQYEGQDIFDVLNKKRRKGIPVSEPEKPVEPKDEGPIKVEPSDAERNKGVDMRNKKNEP